ncbi:hypothetical protein [Photorhabdus tasmaniensis]|uniref:Shiga toxin A subunit n=1 Tax=Photorhabdus tasmaniensis TaxID=1004159 RepID=A0ABX0GDK3_9GAMM|nr:hypothetical protein [Photorhabdus tasmaniensis]NHB86497.1 hypothetical protein [Photorhabdus tasmaniensis]
MIMRLLPYFLLLLPFNIYADSESCIQTGGYIEMNMRGKMINDLNIHSQDVDLKKTRIELLSDIEINKILAAEFAKKAVEKDKSRDSSVRLRYKDYYENYTEYNPHNLILKFTYFNKQDDRNIFIASAIVNDIECSVSFSDYLTVNREF